MRGKLPAALLLLCTIAACSPYRLIRYAIAPDAPTFDGGERIELSGLEAPVDVAQRADGVYRIRAASEADAALAEGYLMARDRMMQMDLFRRIALGETAALLGDRKFGERTTVQMDVLNRFLGFGERADRLEAKISPQEHEVAEAFTAGINAWIAEGRLSLEHRLLGVEAVRPWTVRDSLAIYVMFMHGLSGNADREIRRLVVACRSGIEAMERVFPTDIEYAAHALPEADLRAERYSRAPAVVPEMAAALPELCPQGTRSAEGASETSFADVLVDGWSASNNWVVAGFLTASGKPILSSDPHLPHMNPPLVWAVEVETPEEHAVGFTLPGIGRIVFGHNGNVAWGITTNHVDRQDLVIYRPRSETRGGEVVEGYELDGAFVPFERRTESFDVKDGEPLTVTARITRDGPLLNDIDALLRDRIPLTAMRRTPLMRGEDLDGARRMNHARSLEDLAAGINELNLGCSSYVLADRDSIAYRSPCVVPKRDGFSGAFPIPGWSRRWDWNGFYDKSELPASTNPERGWLATANNRIVPSDRFPSTYNADVSAPNRFLRIRERLADATRDRALTASVAANIQMDREFQPWSEVRRVLADGICGSELDDLREERRLLCGWDGNYGPESSAATLFVFLTNALLDEALADDFPDGVDDPDWAFVQSLPQFEVRAQWLWTQAPDASVWDDERTDEVESRRDVLLAAFADAVDEVRSRFGGDPDAWAWGEVRPFVLRHPFANDDGVLGWFVNEDPLAIGGGPETVFKNQFARGDRERLNPLVGPVLRFTIDMADPWRATYSLAGGQSGWPMSEHYGDLLEDWAEGRGRPLTPPPAESDITVTFLPGS